MTRLQRRLETIRLIKPWQRTLYIMFIAQFVGAIGFSMIFPFLPLYITTIGSRTNLSIELLSGLVFSVGNFTMMFASPVWGALADRYGRKLMVQRSTYGGAILILLMAFVRSAEELILLRAVQGLVTGMVSASNALVASVAPRNQSGFALGLLQVGLWGGVAVGPFIGGIIADLFGYEMAFFVTAILLAIAGVLVHVGVQEDFVPPLKDESSEGSSKVARVFKFIAVFLGEWKIIFQASGVSLTFLLRFLSNLARMMIFPIAPLFVMVLMPDSAAINTITGLVIGAAAAASTVTAIYLGRLGDRIGPRRVLQASAFAAALFYFPQSFVTNAWQLLILQVLTGAAAGGILPTISALLARYTKPGQEGSAYGLDNSIGAGARALSPLVGAVIAAWFGLRTTFAATGVMFLVIALIAFWRLPDVIVIDSETPLV